MRIIVLWGLCWGPPVLRSCHWCSTVLTVHGCRSPGKISEDFSPKAHILLNPSSGHLIYLNECSVPVTNVENLALEPDFLNPQPRHRILQTTLVNPQFEAYISSTKPSTINTEAKALNQTPETLIPEPTKQGACQVS